MMVVDAATCNIRSGSLAARDTESRLASDRDAVE
jgi:hypothetical protein